MPRNEAQKQSVLINEFDEELADLLRGESSQIARDAEFAVRLRLTALLHQPDDTSCPFCVFIDAPDGSGVETLSSALDRGLIRLVPKGLFCFEPGPCAGSGTVRISGDLAIVAEHLLDEQNLSPLTRQRVCLRHAEITGDPQDVLPGRLGAAAMRSSVVFTSAPRLAASDNNWRIVEHPEFGAGRVWPDRRSDRLLWMHWGSLGAGAPVHPWSARVAISGCDASIVRFDECGYGRLTLPEKVSATHLCESQEFQIELLDFEFVPLHRGMGADDELDGKRQAGSALHGKRS